ncbi:yebR protein [Nannizzia gypsea CBS 118893]|uniref:YebR protein n=1 Tax=Arthroderma gypseum (strain ATCC MYA-4604 / CBS 118893) TaxID=535722 RepID=E5R1M2_ARTGP|nr:yebR protein [Nannizzia gypsea CBS 118893]EFQ97720.1 yebR protein [Nannizzia gypsea CBS 118893]
MVCLIHSSVAIGASKEEIYKQVIQQTKGLIEGQRHWVPFKQPSPYYFTLLTLFSNTANVASLLWHAYASLPAPSSSVNWAGFYIREDKFPSSVPEASRSKTKLLLGPFQGKPACQWINFGRGVCGTAAERKETVIVPDVLNWEGHIACDADSRSEIVVPILVNGETVAIIDIDCAEPSGFDEVDKKGLEELAAVLTESCDW